MTEFNPCEVCGSAQWTPVHTGAVRDGAFGNTLDDGIVAQCGGCGIQRLAERCCIPPSYYETKEYREKLGQALDDQSFYCEHDHLHRHALAEVLNLSPRGKVFADIGCGPGGFADHIAGLVREVWAIEPTEAYQDILRAKGYRSFSYAEDVPDSETRAELAVSLQVIEHISDPVGFLRGIHNLLTPDGQVLLTTPNRDDILMQLLPTDYRAFFYRVVHRWYFDMASLTKCAEQAGFEVQEMRTVHRYGLSNAMHWLRDRRPRGGAGLPGLNPALDATWAQHLEAQGFGDTLVAVLRPKAS